VFSILKNPLFRNQRKFLINFLKIKKTLTAPTTALSLKQRVKESIQIYPTVFFDWLSLGALHQWCLL
jgi:ABC-type uncharacterized transport system ATPase subunit